MVINNPYDFAKVIDQAYKELAAGLDIWWRGHSKSTWKLIPSVYRENRGSNYEQAITFRFRLKAPARYPNCPTTNTDWLFLMQHYRLLTRLLDWSESPLVALFFAVSEYPSEPAALWALNPFRLNEHQIGQPATMEVNDEVVRLLSNPPFGENSTTDADTQKIVAVQPPHRDIRMVLQQSTSTIHGTRTPLEELGNKEKFLLKIEIPSSVKRPLKHILDRLGIRKYDLFPDLEHLAEEVTSRTYVRMLPSEQ